jgi:hypothetical protein
MICILRKNELTKDFAIYYLFKMQPNALLIWQKIIIVKSVCYNFSWT